MKAPPPSTNGHQQPPAAPGWFARLNYIFDLDVSANAKLVFLCLVRHMNDHGRCWPSLPRIANLTALSMSSVFRALRELKARAAVRVEKEKRKRRRDANVFVLGGPAVSVPQTATPDVLVSDGQQRYCPTDSNVTVPQTPEHDHRERDQGEHDQSSLKDKHTPPTPRRGERVRAKDKPRCSSRKTQEGDAPGFAEFWAAYPRKVAEDKAREVWDDLKPDAELRAVILAAIERQKATDQWRLRKAIPNPDNWLRQRRWKDEIYDAKNTGSNSLEFDTSMASGLYE